MMNVIYFDQKHTKTHLQYWGALPLVLTVAVPITPQQVGARSSLRGDIGGPVSGHSQTWIRQE